jgi:1,4-dihydroxy-2-naphthoate octaprenyltransferase
MAITTTTHTGFHAIGNEQPEGGSRGWSPERPAGAVKIWLLACRPKTLSAAAAPVVVGSAVAYAGGGFRLLPALAALMGALAIQVGTNLANDVFDFVKGADTPERLGPLRVTQSGLLTPGQVRRGMVLAFAVAGLLGVYLIVAAVQAASHHVGTGMGAGLSIVLIGLASIGSGIGYTAGRHALGYLGLGDLFVFVFFGPVAVAGTVLVQLGAVPPAAWWSSVPVGALATAILAVNNLRDRNTDVHVGKQTLAVRFGATAVRWEYTLLLTAAYATAALAALRRSRPSYLLPALTLPLALRLVRTVWRHDDGPHLNRALARTALLLLAFGLLWALAVGWAGAPAA